MSDQTYQCIWVRWIPSTWEKGGEWTTSIQANTLADHSLTKAIFILEDMRCVFIPMEGMRGALSSNPPNNAGTIVFVLNPRKKTVNGIRLDFGVVTSQTKRKKDNRALWDSLNPN